MGLRFRKSVGLSKGVRLNLGKKSAGISVGNKYAGMSFNSRSGSRARVSLPGTGLSYSAKLGGGRSRSRRAKKNETAGGTIELKELLMIILKIIQWVLSIFMALVAVMYFPSFASILAILFVVLCVPIEKLRELFASIRIKGLAKAAVLCVLFFAAILTTPSIGSSQDGSADVPADIVSEQPEPDKEVTQEAINPSPEQEVQPPPSPEQAPTHESKPSPSPEVTQNTKPEPSPEQEVQPSPSPEQAPTHESKPSPSPEVAQNTKPEPTPEQQIDPEQAFRESLFQYTYVGSSESDKVHTPGCRWTKKINDSNLVHFDSKEAAESAGYSACGTCKPW